MTMFRTVSNRSKLTFSLFFVIAWLIPICDLSAQSYWDAIFELGYKPTTQKADPAFACRRIEGIHRFRELIFDHLTVDRDLLIKLKKLNSRKTSLDVANVYDFLPYSDSDGMWRAIGVRGQSDLNAYRLKMADPDIEEWLNFSTENHPGIAGSQEHFGDIGLGIFIRPLRKDTFKFLTEARLYLADIPAAKFFFYAAGIIC
jgi:hypothetical protein